LELAHSWKATNYSKMATYQAVVLTGKGGLEKLEVQTFPKPKPVMQEVLVKIICCGSGATDLTMRKGYYIFAPKFPFVIGYDAVGIVAEIGPEVKNLKVGDKVAALLVYGGNGEYLLRKEADFVKVPANLDDAKVVALILNYATAYQMIHRKVKTLKQGDTALVTAASGGVGIALLELLKLIGVKVYASCSEKKFDFVKQYGAIPVADSRSGKPVNETLRALVPEGVDASFDCIGGKQYWECVNATKRGGTAVGYGFMGTFDTKTGLVNDFQAIRGIVGCSLARFYGVRGMFYGITADYKSNPKPFQEDFATLCSLLAEGKIDPVIAQRLPFFQAKEAQQMLEKGGISGKIVLVKDL
jgi:NADPH2:quinone reductase